MTYLPTDILLILNYNYPEMLKKETHKYAD